MVFALKGYFIKFVTHLTVTILFGQTTDAKNDENGDADLSEYDEDDEDDEDDAIDMELDFKEQFLKDMNEADMDDHSSYSSSTSSTSSAVNSQNLKSLNYSQNLISKEEAAVVDNKQQLQQRRTVVASSNMNHSERVSGFAAEGFEEYLSQDSIAQAILKPCCHGECLRKKLNSIGGSSCLNFESVYEKILAARKQLVGNKTEDKMLILKTIIQGIYVYMRKKTLSFVE